MAGRHEPINGGAPVSAGISRLEGMEAHARTSDIRLEKWFSGEEFLLAAND